MDPLRVRVATRIMSDVRWPRCLKDSIQSAWATALLHFTRKLPMVWMRIELASITSADPQFYMERHELNVYNGAMNVGTLSVCAG